ncbi:MAG: thymidine kinase [Lachnospiraceae bacterium]|nr:thymidine kinase [Lachnospiraceae bacterium]
MKLYFYYGAMGASKTANALMTRFNFEDKGKKVAMMKPSIDTRDGANIIRSRAGLEAEATLIKPGEMVRDVLPYSPTYYDNIIVDECQFLTKAQVDELREIVDAGTMVMCYGLRADFRSELFEGSKRLLEVADTIREIVTMCQCGRKAIMNARFVDGKVVYDGDQILIGADEHYVAMCHRCYMRGVVRKP